MAYDPRVVQGSVLRYATTLAGTYADIPGVRAFKQTNSQAEEIDITAINDTAKRKLSGLSDNGSLTFQLVYDPADTVHIALYTAHAAGTVLFFRYGLNAQSAYHIPAKGTIRKFEYSGDTGNPHIRDVEILLDGAFGPPASGAA